MRILAVTNMYPTPATPTSGTFVEQQIAGLRQVGLDVEILFVNRIGDGMRAYLKVPDALRARIKTYDPDLVHVMYGGVMAAQVTRTVRDRSVVVTFHGSDLLGEILSGKVRKMIAGLGVIASASAARRAARVIVVSRGLEAALARRTQTANVCVIPCGVDLERFTPMDQEACRTQLGWDKGSFHVLFPANDGNAVKRPALARAAVEAMNRLGVPAKLHYLKGVPHRQVVTWLNASHVLLMTSLHEGSPTIVKEALACGIPTVSVDVGDVAEQIKDVDGCYISPADPAQLAGMMLRVYHGLRRVAGRSSVLEFSLERIARRVLGVYEDVLRTRPASLERAS
jgi:teichuronic acid biosynthesis glycosyltransferase TuaC